MERQAALMAPGALPFRRPLTVNLANMVKQPHMAVDTGWTPHVPAALTVSVKVTAPAVKASAKQALDMAHMVKVQAAQAALDPAQQVTAKAALDPVQQVTAKVALDPVQQVTATAALDPVQQVTAKAVMVKRASVKLDMVKPVTELAVLAQVWQRKALAANMVNMAQTQFTVAVQPHWAQAHLTVAMLSGHS